MLQWSLFRLSTSSRGERPQWIVSLLSRENAGEVVLTLNATPLSAPLVTWGRIVRPVWCDYPGTVVSFVLTSHKTG
jgi:hypothetical protein